MKPRRPETHAFREASRQFEDGLARICGLYGVNPLAGRLYAVLFLSTEPVPLEELGARVSAAKSTVSVALRTLLAARVVRRLPRRSDRRDWYEAVADPWAVIAEWNRLFFQPELAMWRETGEAIVQALSARDAPPADAKRAIRARLDDLEDFAGIMDGVLASLARPSGEKRERARTIRIEEEP